MTPILKSQRNMTIDETVMGIRRLKRSFGEVNIDVPRDRRLLLNLS